MSEFKIEDAIDVALFAERNQVLTAQQTNFINSSAVTRSPQLDAFLAGGGSQVEVHAFGDLSDDELDVSTDDKSVIADVSSIGTLTENAARMSRSKSWSTMDLARAINSLTTDPLDAIAGRTASYFGRRNQNTLLKAVAGVFAANAAGPDDLTLDISGSEFSTATAISSSAIVDALTPMGTSQASVGTIVLHPVQYATLKKADLILRLKDPATGNDYDSVLGLTVVVEDNMPANAGVYTAYLMGEGAIQYGLGSPVVPVEVSREALVGNGSGQTILTVRQEAVFHPTGHSYSGANNPTDAILADAGSYTRVYPERNQIKLVQLITREA